MRGYDLQRTGNAVDAVLKPPFIVKWIFDRGATSGAWTASPIIVNGVLYQGDRMLGTNFVWALDAETGSFLWKLPHLDFEVGEMAYSYNDSSLKYCLFKGTTLGKNQFLESLDIASHVIQWTITSTYGMYPMPLGSLTYALDSSGTLMSVDNA